MDVITSPKDSVLEFVCVTHTCTDLYLFSQNYFSFLELFLLLLYLNRLGLINLFPCSQRFCSAVARKKRIISFLAPIS